MAEKDEELENRPVYEWALAKVGDTRKPQHVTVRKERIDLYVSASGDNNPLFTDEAFAKSKGFSTIACPVAMTTRMAPHNRRTIMMENGYQHPIRPTPFARWQCKLHSPMKPGDVITSEAKVGEKFEKRGRKYIVWHVVARNQNGETVVEYRTTNSWEGSKPEDKTR